MFRITNIGFKSSRPDKLTVDFDVTNTATDRKQEEIKLFARGKEVRSYLASIPGELTSRERFVVEVQGASAGDVVDVKVASESDSQTAQAVMGKEGGGLSSSLLIAGATALGSFAILSGG